MTNGKNQSVQSIDNQFEQLIDQILSLENSISLLTDYSESLSSDQKNQLFQEFERLNQNITSITRWLSFPISQKSIFKVSPSTKILIQYEEDSMILNFLEIAKK